MSSWTARIAQWHHPSDKTVRRMAYSGKKNWFTNNTNVYANADGMMIGILRSYVGSADDIMLFMEDPIPFDRWAKFMSDNPSKRRQDPCLGRQDLSGNL